MSVEAAFANLETAFTRLDESLNDLLWAVVEGQPTTEPGHALVDHYESWTNDALGLVQESKEAIARARRLSNRGRSLQERGQALLLCQERLNRISICYYRHLSSHAWYLALGTLARKRGGEWARWVQGVKDALARCPESLDMASQALVQGWQNLLECTGSIVVMHPPNGAERSAPAVRDSIAE